MNKFALAWSLATRELKSQYTTSFLGFGWAVLNPAITIAVFWVIFSLGFKLQPVQDVPFIVWLIAGFAPWWCFAEIVSKSTTCLVENSHLLKKTIFAAYILPLSIVIVALFNHLIVLIGLAVVMYVSDVAFQFANLQFIYYLIYLVLFALGLGLLTAALNTLSRDTSHFVGSILQIGFWATPIFWTLSLLPENIQHYFTYNPMFYVVEGYRESIITPTVLVQDLATASVFWFAALVVLVFGSYVFGRLRPHFADLL